MGSEPTGKGGRTARRVVTVMMAITGAAFFFVFLLADVADPARNAWSDLPWGLILRYILAMGIGGGLAGALLSGLFGRSGIGGWLLAAIGGCVVMAVAGLLGSAVGLLPDLLADGWAMNDLIKIGFGALVLPLSLVGNPIALLAWLILLAVTHIWAARRRRAASPRDG
jgi:MFS family permease